MSVDFDGLWQGVLAFYLGGHVLAALVATVPGALVEKKSCATLERFHFLLFFFGGAALIVYLHAEIIRVIAPENLWIANASMACVAGLYLGNVTARRLRNAGKKSILALLIWVPVVNIAFLVALAGIPTAPNKVHLAMDIAALPESGHLEASS
ncbi:MAG: hypothetical protein NUV50_08840 [Rhodospirillales bacterium]|nr:hypothetical protein [Rhodospirillales bacterium]